MLKKVIEFVHNNLFNIIVSFLLILIYMAIFILYINVADNKYSKKDITLNNQITMNEVAEEKEEIVEYIYVDVKGSIKKPNVYKLTKGSRVNDAIKAAGGLLKGANTRFINLSKLLNDGDVIVVYSDSEIKKAKKTNTIVVNTPCICEEVKNDACYKEESTNMDSKLVNINTATLEELLTLSGIGEAKARAIIEYRQTNGNFNTIEDIIKVSGISETIFSKIKNYITI